MNHYFTDNRQLTNNRKEISFRFSCFNYSFMTDDGVFSKAHVDDGTIALLNGIANEKLGVCIIDLGCGYGVVGIVVKNTFKPDKVIAIDVNSRACELTKINANLNKVEIDVKHSNSLENIDENIASSILLNPPIRAGKEIIYKMFEESYNKLEVNGSIYIVMRKQHGALSAKSKLSTIFGNCEQIFKEKGFFVYKSTKKVDNLL